MSAPWLWLCPSQLPGLETGIQLVTPEPGRGKSAGKVPLHLDMEPLPSKGSRSANNTQGSVSGSPAWNEAVRTGDSHYPQGEALAPLLAPLTPLAPLLAPQPILLRPLPPTPCFLPGRGRILTHILQGSAPSPLSNPESLDLWPPGHLVHFLRGARHPGWLTMVRTASLGVVAVFRSCEGRGSVGAAFSHRSRNQEPLSSVQFSRSVVSDSSQPYGL